MWSGITRRLFVFTLSMAMAIGLSAHAVRATQMELKAVGAMATDMPTSGAPASSKCDGCGDEQKAISPAACSAYCASIVALPITLVLFDAVPNEILGHPVKLVGTGHADPPDPYPPRPTILS
jgi:hypothetical protein